MLNLPRWQTIGIIAVTVLAAIFALPNLLPASVLDHLPGWYAQSRINLGLDLRGGAHFLLEADLRSLMSERLTNLSDSVRADLRKEQVAFKDITVEGGRTLVVTLRDDSQRAKAVEAIRAVDRSLVLSGSGDTIQVSYADQELTRRKKEVIDQSIEILRRRVDETGTIEPTIVRQGDDRILLAGAGHQGHHRPQAQDQPDRQAHLPSGERGRGGVGPKPAGRSAANHDAGALAGRHAGFACHRPQGLG